MQRRITLLFVLIILLAAAPVRAFAQSGDFVLEVDISFSFGEEIVISGGIDPAVTNETVSIQLTFPGDSRTVTAPLVVEEDGSFEYTHSIAERFVQAFSDVRFQFVLETPGGQILMSEPYTFFYSDNRYDWRMLEDGPFRVHWYEGDLAYARQALDAAQDGYGRAQTELDTAPPAFVEIYLYARLADYQFARGQMGQLWAGGHADPASGLVLVSVPPGSEAELESARKIPHEMAHLALFQATGAGYWNIPAWLNEGFSSLMEMFPNPDYDFLVSRAREDGTLIAFGALCDPFPQDASGALLAYAQSTSLVRYIEQAYGAAGLRAVVDSYAAGAGCVQGTQADPVGVALTVLEAAWLDSFGAVDSDGVVDEEEITPMLLVFAVVLVGPLFVLVGSGLRKGGKRGG